MKKKEPVRRNDASASKKNRNSTKAKASGLSKSSGEPMPGADRQRQVSSEQFSAVFVNIDEKQVEPEAARVDTIIRVKSSRPLRIPESRPSLPTWRAPLPVIKGAKGIRRVEWHVRSVGADLIPFTGAGVKVAVLDSGIDLNHEAFGFGGQIPTKNRRDFVDGASVQDVNGHGTHCAGLIAGRVTPKGRTRYSISPNAELLIGKVVDRNGKADPLRVLEAIKWAADSGAKIISISLGYLHDPTAPDDEDFCDVCETVARQLLKGSDGVLLLAAAGSGSDRRNNKIERVMDPAGSASVMAVTAVDSRKEVTNDSCAEVPPDVAEINLSAPGVDVYSAWTGNLYRRSSGSSVATPIVAGVAALLWEKNPKFTAEKLWDKLKRTARSLPDSKRKEDYGWGFACCLEPGADDPWPK